MVCSRCGEDHDVDSGVCPDCENEGKTEVAGNREDPTVGRLGILFLGIPIVGFIMYLFWRVSKPEKAKTAGCLALLGFGLGIVACFFTSATDSESQLQSVDYTQRHALRDATRVRQFADPREIHDLLQGDDLPWMTYLLIWNRLEEGTEVYRVVTDILFDSTARDDTGDATLRDLSDGSWRKPFADCALKYAELRIATVEAMREIYETNRTREHFYSENVRVLMTGTFSLEQLLLYVQNSKGRYGQYEVVCGSMPEEAEEVRLDPIIGVHVVEGNSLILRTAPSCEDKHVQVTPIHFNELVRELEFLKEDCSDYNVVCSESDLNDDSSTICIELPVSGIGVNDEHQLFVLLFDDMILSVTDR